MRKIKIGILGYSNIAKKSIIPVLFEHPKFDLQFIASRSLKKQQEIKEEYSIQTGTYNQLLHKDLDAIYVSVPVGLHYELGKEVLNSGKHLLLEKTFTNSFETTKELLEIAIKQKVVAMEALMYQYHPLFKKVKELIENGEVGEIKHIEAYFGFPHLDINDIRYGQALGGGATLDALVYPLSLIISLLGKQYKNYFSTITFNTNYPVDENGTVYFEYPESSAIIKYGFGLAYRNEYKIWGTEGILAVKRGFSRPEDYVNSIVIEKNTKEAYIDIPASNHFYNMFDTFYEKVNGLNDDQVDYELLARMEIIDNVYREGYKI